MRGRTEKRPKAIEQKSKRSREEEKEMERVRQEIDHLLISFDEISSNFPLSFSFCCCGGGAVVVGLCLLFLEKNISAF